MLGDLIQHLHRPEVAAAALESLPDPALAGRVTAAAEAAGLDTQDYVAALVRGFLDHADDDRWVQLVGIMGKARDPGLAALEAIFRLALDHEKGDHEKGDRDEAAYAAPPAGSDRP